MFKKIPGNHEYVISFNGKIKKTDNSECTLVINNNLVEIELYGKKRLIDVKWLSLISHFEVNLPKQYVKELFHIKFINIRKETNINYLGRKSSISGKLMVFRRPLVVNKRFRIIPNYTDLAVSKDGIFIEVETGKSINVKTKVNQYPTIQIYCPDKSKRISKVAHRLIALAWCINENPYDNSIINHIDGNKKNFHASNLEWITYSENANHAYRTDLRNDNICCRILDTLTQEELEFYSISEADRYMRPGTSKRLGRHRIETKRPNLLYGRYEIRLKDDNTPWFYIGNRNPKKIGKYIITVTDPKGNVNKYYDTRDLKKNYKLWNVSNIKDQISKFNKLYPSYIIEYEDIWGSDIVQALNIETNQILEAPTVLAMSRLINVPRHHIMRGLGKGERYVRDGYAYRHKINKDWNKDFVINVSNSVCIQATNLETQEVLNFPSGRAAAKYFKVDRSTIDRRLGTDECLGSWKLNRLNK